MSSLISLLSPVHGPLDSLSDLEKRRNGSVEDLVSHKARLDSRGHYLLWSVVAARLISSRLPG